MVEFEIKSVEVEFDIVKFKLLIFEVSDVVLIENEGVVKNLEFVVVDMYEENVGIIE